MIYCSWLLEETSWNKFERGGFLLVKDSTIYIFD